MKNILKKITENEDSHNDAKPGQYISGELTVLTTGAEENKDIKNMDVESQGRFLQLKTQVLSQDPLIKRLFLGLR